MHEFVLPGVLVESQVPIGGGTTIGENKSYDGEGFHDVLQGGFSRVVEDG